MHRDIKNANIFLQSDGQGCKCVLGDFGVGKKMEQNKNLANTVVGTITHMCPEMWNQEAYTNKADIWAMGCVLYEMCSLQKAFVANSEQQLKARILRKDPARIPSQYGDEMWQLCQSMLHKDPQARISIGEILSLPFIIEHCQKWLPADV